MVLLQTKNLARCLWLKLFKTCALLTFEQD